MLFLIEPGTVQTPIIAKFSEQVEQYGNTEYAAILEPMAAVVDEREAGALPVAIVSRAIYEAITASSPKTRYALPLSDGYRAGSYRAGCRTVGLIA